MTAKATEGPSGASAVGDDDLDAALAGLRGDVPPSDAVMRRVLADADAVQATFRVAPVRRPAQRLARPGLLAQFMRAIGGGAGLATLGLASVTGVFLGFADPLRLDLMGTLSGAEDTASLDPLLGMDWGFDGEDAF